MYLPRYFIREVFVLCSLITIIFPSDEGGGGTLFGLENQDPVGGTLVGRGYIIWRGGIIWEGGLQGKTEDRFDLTGPPDNFPYPPDSFPVDDNFPRG